MSSTSDHRQQPASADWARREQLLQEFDRAWQRGERPDIDAYRKGAAADSTLLAELVHIDLERRIKRGEPARIEDYLARFPELAACLPTRPQTAGTAEVGAAAPAGDAGLDLRTYELLDRVGRGGMGEVFRGTDPALGRDLAVKVLRPELRGLPGAEGRFAQEARLTGALQHPNIVPVHNLGRLPDGRLYFTMKLVRGRTLADLLTGENDAALRLELLDVFEKVCQAVAYAHSKGVIHRDLKPANVMVGSFGEVQVMDWGLAKVLAEGGVADEEKASRGLTPSLLPISQAVLAPGPKVSQAQARSYVR